MNTTFEHKYQTIQLTYVTTFKLWHWQWGFKCERILKFQKAVRTLKC